ncbi:TRAP transporter small permease subunit [Arthrobacter sp. KNU-44]|uniref:TRAP transporter small permease subunit n=1 Tax=Arthrobacter sp. KNU-44 TaxID=3450744 RepID=UPI003F43BCC3
MVSDRRSIERLAWLKWIDRISTATAALAGIATLGMMINVIIDVIGRYAFKQPLPGTLDLVTFAWMPSLVSLGLGFALLRGEMVRVSLLTAPTSPRTQRIIEILGMTLMLFTVGFLLWFGVEKAIDSTDLEESAVGTPWLPVWVFRWAVMVGLAVLLLQSAAQLLRAATVKVFVPDDADELEAEAFDFNELDDVKVGTR